MKTLQLVNGFTTVGGVETYTRGLIDHLEAAGHSTMCVTSVDPAPADVGSVQVHLPDITSVDEVAQRRAWNELVAAVRAFEPDVALLHTYPSTTCTAFGELMQSHMAVGVFAHNYLFCPSGRRHLARSNRVCEVASPPSWRCVVNTYTERCGSGRPSVLAGAFALSRRIMRWLRTCDGVIVDSEFVRDQFAGAGGMAPDRLLVVPSAIVTTPALDLPPPPKPFVLFAGRLVDGKGVDRLLHAWSGMPEGVTLLIAGDGFRRAELERTATMLGLPGRVRFLGPTPAEELRMLMHHAEFFVFPSVWPEPFGMVGLEAMSVGTPVVACARGAIPEWLPDGEAGLLAGDGDVQTLRAAMLRLLGDDDLRDRLGRQGRVHAQAYGWAAHMPRMVTALEMIAARGSSRLGSARLVESGSWM